MNLDFRDIRGLNIIDILSMLSSASSFQLHKIRNSSKAGVLFDFCILLRSYSELDSSILKSLLSNCYNVTLNVSTCTMLHYMLMLT